MAKIGIDLGTSNSLVAHWTEQGPVIIPNSLGNHLTPSVVSLDDNDEILVGQIAKERLITHPQLTASTFKRYMGTDKQYPLGKYTFTPEDLSSFVLRSLKDDAEAYLSEEIEEAVISVPAYFNDAQRKATLRAASLAGLHVERLISEPTAAAVSYGLHLQEADTQFLVFDLGGGTFDVSVLELFEGIMQVQSIAGDNYLGGEDFTGVLLSYFVESNGIDYANLSSKAQSALIKQAELCKLALGNGNAGEMVFTEGEQTYQLTVDRNQYEQLTAQLLLRLRNPIERALRDASLMPQDLDAVILIGGATRMPFIKTIVSKIFGRLPYSQINPDEAVALGAAIQVALKDRDASLQEMILTDVCPFTLGTSISIRMPNGGYEGGHFDPIIERNTPIPVSKVQRYTTLHPFQDKIRITVYQGESRKVENNVKLGELDIPVPVAAAGEEEVDVRYTYDINGVLEVELTAVSTRQKRTVIIEKNPGQSSPEQIQARLEELKHLKIHPRDRSENRLLLARGERLYEESLHEKRDMIANLLIDFERVLASQDEQEIKKKAVLFKQKLDSLERWLEF
ncbi:molecular chaperone HscC [Fontibacillus panacisegetis]|uniref:Chaperone protein DnaK n=1 Tax=Fontibacillus panacisegetis TaxID=670482 RepID=A0A1G7SR63_9BACL|nr:molecular chaperone HscC [Fontibacillus panacisegetis]SDG24760.1 molecular chaperone HscC [Fontibacillus panacisegetis]